MYYYSKRIGIVCVLTGLFWLVGVRADAQYPNAEKDVLAPLRKMADSLLMTAQRSVSPKDASDYLEHMPAALKYPVMFQTSEMNAPELSPQAIYLQDQPAVGLVAMCGKPNPLHEVSLNPASAFVITPEGICVTNYHVIYAYAHTKTVEDKGVFLVRLGNGKTYVLEKILAVSPQNDIALIQLDTKREKLPFLQLSGMDASIGDDAYVLGNPSGLLYSFTKGMISGKYNQAMALPGGRGVANRNLMSITADFAVGASGSPILDNRGSVIGIVSSTNIIEQPSNGHQLTQMVIKNTIPVSSLINLIRSRVPDRIYCPRNINMNQEETIDP